jgi:hypothetical protein
MSKAPFFTTHSNDDGARRDALNNLADVVLNSPIHFSKKGELIMPSEGHTNHIERGGYYSIPVDEKMWKICQIRGHQPNRHGGTALGDTLPYFVCKWCHVEYTVETVITEITKPINDEEH